MGITEMVNDLIREELRHEANGLVKLADKEDIDELMVHHNAGKYNLFCLCLDKIKFNLVKRGIITKLEYPNFGGSFEIE